MKKIIEYKVVANTKLKEFNKSINDLIKDGWQPDGTARMNRSTSQYYQTMIKFQESSVQIVNDTHQNFPPMPFYNEPMPMTTGDNISSTKYFKHPNPISSSNNLQDGHNVHILKENEMPKNANVTMYDAEPQDSAKIKREKRHLFGKSNDESGRKKALN